MSVHPTTTTSTIARGVAVAGTTLAALAFCATASATAPSPDTVEGNPTCAAAGAGYTEVKIEPVPQGRTTFEGEGLTGAIEVDGVLFDWTTSQPITAVVVKGGPSANVYRFAPATSGTDWHAPINPNTGRPYGLSHISFCAGGPATTPPPDGGTTPPPATCDGTTTPPPASCGQTTPPPATTPPTSTTPPATTPPAGDTPPQQEVLDDTASGGPRKPRRRPVAAIARLGAPRRCVTGPARVTVRGTGIQKVVFRVNGRKVAVLRGRRSAYAARVTGAKDVLRVTARVTFVAASRKPARTLRTTVLACRSSSPAVAPHFTG